MNLGVTAARAVGFVLLSSALLACTTAPRPIAKISPTVLSSEGRPAQPIAIFVGDSQERELFGHITGLSALEAHQVSGVAVRSSEQELFGKYVLRSVMDHEAPTTPVIHLGDFLDYSCESEWDSAAQALTPEEWRRFFMLPGNHDGLFQGNNNYGEVMKATLALQGKDADLQGHFKAVCDPLWRKLEGTSINPEFRKRDVVCAYLDKMVEVGLTLPAHLTRSCKAVKRARSKSVKNTPAAVLQQAQLGEPSRIGNVDLRLAVSLTGWSTENWSKGYLLQTLKLPRPATSAATPDVHLLLIDTADWHSEPEFGPFCWSRDNANCGAVDEVQRKAIDAALENLQAGSLVLLAGHYPVGKLHRDTADWLLSRMDTLLDKGLNTAYLSAHSHDGAVTRHRTARGREVVEVNVDSLMDWPVSYWSLTREAGAYCLVPHDAWAALDCESYKTSAVPGISNKAVDYFQSMSSGLTDLGEKQWWLRATDARRALEDFGREESSPVQCQVEQVGRSKPRMAAAMHACRSQLDALIGRDPGLRRKAACTSIAGAASFAEPQKLERRRPDYAKVCFPDGAAAKAGQ